MFESLKKKLKSFLGVQEPEAKKGKKPKKKSSVKKSKEKKQKKPKIPSDKQLKEAASKIQEEVPLKFDSGKLKYEPDEEAIKSSEQPKEEKKGFFARFTERFTSSKITKSQVEEIFVELEIILLENNVALEVVDKIKSILFDKLVNTEARKSNLQAKVISSLKEAISLVMQDPPNLLNLVKSKSEPYVIL